jgi:ABC-type lipoprotein release transport system permease subunit
VLLKGIEPGQTVLGVPSAVLKRDAEAEGTVPTLIGRRMAEAAGLKPGDLVTVRWRDVHGAFDALDLEVVEVMTTTVPTVDAGQVWIPLEKLRSMTDLEDQATLIVLAKSEAPAGGLPGWVFKDLDFLLRDIREVVRSKTIGATIIYTVLLFLALLAIFNTQVLSIFHRRKEMGTLMALGMTKAKVIQLFTLEGALHSVLAAVAAALYGIPLMLYISRAGITMPQSVASYGFAIGDKLLPLYSPRLIVTTIALVWTLTAAVSFLPTRRISKLKPTDALRGRLR